MERELVIAAANGDRLIATHHERPRGDLDHVVTVAVAVTVTVAVAIAVAIAIAIAIAVAVAVASAVRATSARVIASTSGAHAERAEQPEDHDQMNDTTTELHVGDVSMGRRACTRGVDELE